jgi:hypothetical protein
MVRSLLYSLIVVSLAASPADAERLVQPAAPGFIIGYQAEADHTSIVERVPAGEDVEVWTRMITTQRFEGLAERSTPQGFLQTLAQSVQRACSGAKASDVRLPNGATVLRADCPLNTATGKPETFFARTIADGGRMHVVQVAFRRIVTAADVQWARAYLNGVALCPDGSKEPVCTTAK